MDIKIGQTLVCNETGKTFVAATDGNTVNYAIDRNDGRVYSDEGMHIRELRDIAEGSGPIYGYLSRDAEGAYKGHITGWKGNKLMRIIYSVRTNSGFGGDMWAVRAKDEQGREWYGRGRGPGMSIKLKRAKKK